MADQEPTKEKFSSIKSPLEYKLHGGRNWVCSLHITRHTRNQWILAERKEGERKSNMTFQRSQESPSRRQGDLLLGILLREVRHSGGSGILKVYMSPESLPKPARMSVKWEAEWRQDSPSFHFSKSHDAVSAGPYATGCLSPLEEGFWRQIYIWAAYEMNQSSAENGRRMG